MQAYEVYVENGNIFPIGRIPRIPERKRGIITILDEPVVDDITLASEESLAKIWLSPKEDEAWADL